MVLQGRHDRETIMWKLTITTGTADRTRTVREFDTKDALMAELESLGIPTRARLHANLWSYGDRYEWSEVADTVTPVRTVECRRCGGTATIVTVSGVPVVCQKCSGTGRISVYSQAQRDAMARTSARRQNALDMIKSVCDPYDGTQDMARLGFDRLEEREPHRLVKLYDSVESGRILDVVRALLIYRAACDA
jgi:hypothetical protein